jgi:hypothetical protein
MQVHNKRISRPFFSRFFQSVSSSIGGIPTRFADDCPCLFEVQTYMRDAMPNATHRTRVCRRDVGRAQEEVFFSEINSKFSFPVFPLR